MITASPMAQLVRQYRKQNKNRNMPIKEVTEQLISVQEEYTSISQRLQKLEERKNSVSEKIFNKVKGEYEEKHAALLKEIRPILLHARQIINELNESIDEKKNLKKEYSESLEEYELRFALGEFDQAEFDSSTHKLKNDIADVDSLINENIKSTQGVKDLIEWFSTTDETFNNIQEDETIETLPEKFDDLDIDEEVLLAGVETIDEVSLLDSFSSPGVTFSGKQEISVNIKTDEKPNRKPAALEKIKNSRVEKIIPLDQGETAVGRGNNNDLVLLDRTVSREHALISLEPDGYILTDLNSTRGTFINGVRSDSKLLEEGDEIIIGSMVFRFKYL